MKIAAVSADLLIKLAIGAAVIGGAVYLLRKASTSVSDAFAGVSEAVSDVADSVIVGINPANSENIVNRGVNAIGGAIVSDTGPGRNADSSWTVGGWLYDVTHPEVVAQRDSITAPVFTGGATGSW